MTVREISNIAYVQFDEKRIADMRRFYRVPPMANTSFSQTDLRVSSVHLPRAITSDLRAEWTEGVPFDSIPIPSDKNTSFSEFDDDDDNFPGRVFNLTTAMRHQKKEPEWKDLNLDELLPKIDDTSEKSTNTNIRGEQISTSSIGIYSARDISSTPSGLVRLPPRVIPLTR